ncbi:DNRLRE domain-containing protein [Dyadobacter flavalbus]|uniref:DNRLRE domain-containing protein n=1 Tax=Dyadobacter flavalbus TaxID=2579942 RepID=A0A5M8R138_9BACT|nr:DNRLRE domain-containing protein [Dyadobacter flavalbus]KAA6440403.1 DNRLRE domain-containing protein [Dyadobacter flavalbus]
MKKFLQTVIVFALSISAVFSQTCNVNSLKTQADIDNFHVTYPGCKVINGDLNIISSSIKNLNGLLDITKVVGSIRINDNSELTSIAGLTSLEQIDGEINIENNDKLPSLHGLENLTRPMGNVRVVYNETLTSISALSGLSTIPGFLSVGQNVSLTSLTGLENLTRIEGAVSIAGNTKLVDLKGIGNLTFVGSFFYLGFNYSLKNLIGLDKLKSVGERLEITGNNSITSLSGINQLETVSVIIATYNPMLTDCAIQNVCSRIKTYNVSVHDNAPGCNSTEEISYNCSLPTAPVRINAGGGTFTTATKKVFSADQYYSGIDRISAAVSGDILNTSNDPLYQTARCSPAFSYNIPVANGEVSVYLHFAETYYGAPGKKGGAGSRQFHVNMEGVRKLTNYDIFAKAGGAMRATAETFTVNVTDGMLNIDFLTGAADLPRVSAIEVIRTGLTLQPNADAYIRDGIYNNTNYGSESNLDIKNIAGELSPKRSSYLRFQLPANTGITSAKLRVYGHNHENSKDISIHAYGVDDDSWTEYGIVRSNAPVVSTLSLGYVAVNSVYKYYEIDVSSYVKAQQQAGDAQVSFLLADPNNRNTRIVFNSKENGSFPPQLIVQTTLPVANSNTRLNQEIVTVQSEMQDSQESTVYPNPVKKQFTVGISMKHAGRISLELINESGKGYVIPVADNIRAGEKTDVDISGFSLNTGIYLLKINSDAAAEVVKVLVTE